MGLVCFIQAAGGAVPCGVWTQCIGLCFSFVVLSAEGNHWLKAEPSGQLNKYGLWLVQEPGSPGPGPGSPLIPSL